jgi:hypothetical protein
VNCDTARIYAGAVADGEVDGVPSLILEHIRQCHDCSTEVQWQREAQSALAGAISEEQVLPLPLRPQLPPRRQRRYLAATGLAAAVAMLLIIGTLAALPSRAPTPGSGADVAMGDAAHVYGRPAAFTSTDVAAISAWSAGRGMPVAVVSLPGEVATGARVSTIDGHQHVTVIYTGPHGATEVTVVPAAMAGGWPTMEATRMGGASVGLVRRTGDSVIVVTPDDAGLHKTMAALQA